MNGEDNKKTIVELDIGANVGMNTVQSFSSKKCAPHINGVLDKRVASVESINTEYLSDKKMTEAKSIKSDKPCADEIHSSEKVIIKPINVEESFIKTLFKEPSELELDFEYNIKVLKRKLKESIAELVKNLGQGHTGPVPYDTAWVARIPQLNDISRPAFPLSLQWLRDHQLEDGSWGSVKPFSAHSSTLNTLATVISFAQWNNPEDKVRIENGVKALWWLADLLPFERCESIGFELIIFSLLKEAKKFGLAVPYKHYECYRQKSDRKLKLISSEFEKHGYSKPATWWYNLEILGDEMQIIVNNNELKFSSNMLTKDGSVGVSPAATAYLLMSHRLKGIDIPEAETYLEHLYSLYVGGIPTVFPIDTFELAFCLDFLIKSSFHAQNPMFKLAIQLLAEHWNPKYGVGYSASWELFDSDDSAVALSVLLKAGYKLSPELILKYFNGTHITTYVGEAHLSTGANFNVLTALRLFNGDKEIDEVIQKILIWVDQSVLDEQVLIEDKWHSSPYYSTFRAVFALHGLRNDIVKHFLNFFIQNQNSDGGWGKDGFTTAEETAYVSMALCYGFKCGYPIPKTILEAASIFLFNSYKLNRPRLWIGKVLYCPTLVTEAAIISAQFALIKTLELIKVRSILETIQPYYMVATVKSTYNEKNYDIVLLCLVPELDMSEYSKKIIRVREHISNRLVELNLIKKSTFLMKSLIPEVTFYNLRKDLCDEDIILHSYFFVGIHIFDIILDENTDKFDKNHTNIISQAIQTLLEIMQGKCESIDMVTRIDFPNFISLCRLFFDIRHLLVKKQSDLSEFLARYEKISSYYIKDVDNIINGVCLSSHAYLEVQKFTAFAYSFHSLSFMLENVSLFSFKDYVIFHTFEDCAMIASRLIQDIFSFQRDKDEGSVYDNYVLIKQIECNCSLEDAINSTAKLINKQIMKMFSLKKAMQRDPVYKNNQELWKAVVIIENCLQGMLDCCSETKRNQSKTSISITRKQLTQVNIPLILQFFENKVEYPH